MFQFEAHLVFVDHIEFVRMLFSFDLISWHFNSCKTYSLNSSEVLALGSP